MALLASPPLLANTSHFFLSRQQLVEAAEAKAYYGLASNYDALLAVADALYERESLTGPELRALLDQHGAPQRAAAFRVARCLSGR